MSLENIIKYATNTPANTNPAVMSSVINNSFKETKEEILNEAKAYSDSKGGYEEQTRGEKIFMVPNAFPFTIHEEFGMGALFVENTNLPLILGETYEVVIDGKAYICEAGEFYGDMYIGLPPADEIPSNPSYPFSFCNIGADCQLIVFDVSPTHVIEVYEITTVIHPIDKKYLPDMGGGGGMTVIELETEIGDDTTMLNEADIAKVSAAMAQKMPVVIKFNYKELYYSFVFNYCSAGEQQETFEATMGRKEFMVVNMVGAWTVVVQDL